MATRKVEKAEWEEFFDLLSKIVLGARAEVEVASLALGVQVQAEWLPLLGIAYDPKDDIIEIALEGLDHIVHKPREVWVDIGTGGLVSLEVIDADGVQQIVRLREPLLLPPPQSTPEEAAPREERQR
jgi:hypothetical protein